MKKECKQFAGDVVLSIVVPVYNVEPFLEDCILSMQDIQTPTEIICINDGSTDDSLSVLKNLAEKFKNIRVSEQENQGVSATRNNGIRLAKGKYICFYDSDDMVVARTIDKAVALLEQECLDCVAYGYETIPQNSNYREFPYTPKKNNTVSHDMELLYVKIRPCTMIMRKALIDDHAISFLHMKYFEDQCFVREVYANCTRAAVLSDVGYLYRMRESSAVHNKNRYKPWVDDAIKGAVHAKKFEENATDPLFKKWCRNAKQLSILHVLTMGMMVKEYTVSYIYGELKKNGLYPVKPMWRLLIPNGKSTVLNYLRFGFFCRWYYWLFYTVTRKLRKI